MDIGNRFSLEDFLAYFFPGVTGLLGLYILFQMTPIRSSLPSLDANIATGIIFFVLSYIVGIIFSSIAEIIFSKIRGHKNVIPLNDELKKIIIESFKEYFDLSKDTAIEWSSDYFYLCRAVVYERAPNILSIIQRQSSLRQLRINLLPALLIWLLVGIGWGVEDINQKFVSVGLIIIVISILLFFLIAVVTIDRAKSNERREVREVITAFAASCKNNK